MSRPGDPLAAAGPGEPASGSAAVSRPGRRPRTRTTGRHLCGGCALDGHHGVARARSTGTTLRPHGSWVGSRASGCVGDRRIRPAATHAAAPIRHPSERGDWWATRVRGRLPSGGRLPAPRANTSARCASAPPVRCTPAGPRPRSVTVPPTPASSSSGSCPVGTRTCRARPSPVRRATSSTPRCRTPGSATTRSGSPPWCGAARPMTAHRPGRRSGPAPATSPRSSTWSPPR